MPEKKEKLGLVVGRFQPLHDGHRFLIKKAIDENDAVVLCIGEARKTDPLSLGERKRRLRRYLSEKNAGKKAIKIVHIRDNRSDKKWVRDLVRKAKITNKTLNTFYSADKNLHVSYMEALINGGIRILSVKRLTFKYKTPDGKIHKVSSATRIRKLHDSLKIPI